MHYRIVTDAAGIDRKQWEEFVYVHPQGTIFHTPQMHDAFCLTRHIQPFVVACYDENELVGLLLASIMKEYKGVLGKLSLRSIVFSGPLIKNDNIDVLLRVLSAYDNLVKNQAIYTQFRNMFDVSWAKPIFHELGYPYEDHQNILIDLKQSEDELWKQVHGKRRNEIRRSYKEKTEFAILDDDNLVMKGYQILKDVYKYAKLPIPDLSLFQSIHSESTPGFGLKIFAALNNGDMIGVMFTLIYKKRIYDWFAGAFRNSLDKYPNDLIPWEVFRWGKANGFEIFDFGGAGKPGVHYGVRDYKLKFGGELVNYGRFEKIHQQIKMNIAKAGFRVWQSLKK